MSGGVPDRSALAWGIAALVGGCEGSAGLKSPMMPMRRGVGMEWEPRSAA